ncbi:MAG TPA: SRPBCC domain-containing protein [Steroidobacteraceae bacterium]
MLPKSRTVADTNIVVDTDAHTIVLTRVLRASCAQVFEAWTQPEQVRCWWDPSGRPLAECVIDLRPGGAFRFVSGHGTDTYEFAGIYREIAPPGRLTFIAMGATGRVMLEEIRGKTHLTVRIECGSASHLDDYLKMGVDAGTARTLDNLVAYVAAGDR